MFDTKKVKNAIVTWLREWFKENGPDCNAVVGISGGVDSSVVAALCVEALGKDKVIGILMPQGEQKDIEDAIMLCKHLDIKYHIIDIGPAVHNLLYSIWLYTDIDYATQQTKQNLPPRIRMTTLYAISQSANGRVANTCNKSETWVGWDTRWGDSCGDFAPLANLTKTEVRLIGKELGLPEELVNKVPRDGLCGVSDEESFGFSYEVLDKYIRTGEIDDLAIKDKIDTMHQKNLFKTQPIASFPYADDLQFTFDEFVQENKDKIKSVVPTNPSLNQIDE